MALQKKVFSKTVNLPIVLFMDKNNKKVPVYCSKLRILHKAYPYKGIFSDKKAKSCLSNYNCQVANLIILSSLIALIKDLKLINISFVIVEVA